MKRREFLTMLGLVGAGAVIPTDSSERTSPNKKEKEKASISTPPRSKPEVKLESPTNELANALVQRSEWVYWPRKEDIWIPPSDNDLVYPDSFPTVHYHLEGSVALAPSDPLFDKVEGLVDGSTFDLQAEIADDFTVQFPDVLVSKLTRSAEPEIALISWEMQSYEKPIFQR